MARRVEPAALGPGICAGDVLGGADASDLPVISSLGPCQSPCAPLSASSVPAVPILACTSVQHSLRIISTLLSACILLPCKSPIP